MVKGLFAWLDAVNAVNHCVCAKHPLLSLTLPELEQAWGQDTYLIRLVRPLQDSIDGLKRRNWFREPERMQRVLHQASEDFFSNGRPHLSVDFGNLLADPMREIRKIVEFLNITVPEDRLNWAAKRIVRS